MAAGDIQQAEQGMPHLFHSRFAHPAEVAVKRKIAVGGKHSFRQNATTLSGNGYIADADGAGGFWPVDC